MQEVQRALSLVGTPGGFAVPIEVDATIVASGAGSLHPFRSVATVRTMVANELRLVASDGNFASYAPAGSEASDDSPTLAQPTVVTARGQAFVPFDWEVGQDWSSMQEEMGRLIADARDVVDASKFVLGTGSDEPVGIFAVGSTGSLTTSQRIYTSGTASYAVADGWTLKAALPDWNQFQLLTPHRSTPSVVSRTMPPIQTSTVQIARLLPHTCGGCVLRQGILWLVASAAITTPSANVHTTSKTATTNAHCGIPVSCDPDMLGRI